MKATELNGKNGDQHWEAADGHGDGEALSKPMAAQQQPVPAGDKALAEAAKKADSGGGQADVSAFSYAGAPHPTNEKERHEALCSCNILDTAPDPRFDNITNLVSCPGFAAPVHVWLPCMQLA